MASTDVNASYTPRPTLTDVDNELLRNIFVQEARYFQQTCSAVDGSSRPLDSTGEESNSPLVKIAASLLRHGQGVQEIHSFFKKLTPRLYLMKLACPIEDDFQVVEHQCRTPYPGSETPEVTNKESGSQLHPQELEIYECALHAAQYPVLATSHDSLDITAQSAGKQSDPSDLSDSSVSPASRECMSYGRDLIRRSGVFEIEPEDLTELVRQAFCLTHRRHEYYLRELEKIVMNDPAKVLVREMRELQLIFNSECHPYFNADLFRRREDYERWLSMEKGALENIIRDQEKHVKTDVSSFPNEVPLVNKDKHLWFKILLVKLFRTESVNCRINVGTREAIPKEPLSPASLRLLDEFGERYRIGFLYRRVCIFEYLARNFECKEWYCKYVISVLESILEFARREGCIVRKDEIKIVKTAITHLHGHVEHILTRINRIFPKNSPEEGLREVTRLLSWLVVVDEDDTFGEHNGITVGQYLKRYAKEEMRTNYERQKIIIADQLKIRSFGQQLTPHMVSLMILDISEKLRSYRMYFKQEFIGYFDIVEMAVEVFYGLLMEDVLQLCDIHPVNQQHQNIDYLMIALAYRLTSFDHDTAWENYLTLEGQVWRSSFLKHSLAWMSSLHGQFHNLICTALQHDTWQGLQTDHTCSLNSMDSQLLHQIEQRTRPREISSPLTGSPSTARPNSAVTPSFNSAFVQVSGRSANAVERESPMTSDIINQSATTSVDAIADQPSSSNVKVTKEPSDARSENTTYLKIPSKSSSSNLLKYVQNTKFLASSVTSQSSESAYTDARSHASDVEDYTSCDGGENDQVLEASHQDYTTIPISSSLIDTVSGINRLINVVRHFSQLLSLCPKKSTTRYDSLRMSPEDRNEIHDKLEQGRVNMARKLGDMIQSLAIFYGYYVIGCESCGMSDEVLEPIIGQRCLTRSLSLIQENGIRPCRHRTAGLERCNTADSHGNCTPPCLAMSRIENNTVQSERVVEEMCVRLNNVRTMKKLLPTLVETAVQNVLVPGPGTDFNDMAVADMSNIWPSLATTSQENDEPSTSAASSAIPNDVVDKNSIEKTVDELQEIEDSLVKLMAYRANDVIKKLLELLLTLNLRSFNSRKRLQPVLNTARKTVHTLAISLYPDCYAAVLRHFWLAIVKDFAEEKENLVFLNGTAKDQANLLLEAISYFIEIFRAEEDSIPLAFVSKTIEPVLQSLNYYTLPTRTLMQMYEALEQRNTSTVRISGSRHRYQRSPSNIFIGRLRIELHSERPYFSGQRFVECVSDRIRYEGNLGLAICAVPNGCDADSGKALGQYLLDNDILCYVGKVVEKAAVYDSDDDDLDEELRRYTRPGSALIIPGRKARKGINDVPLPASPETHSSLSVEGSKTDSTIIIQEDATKPSRFINSDNILYKFKSDELDESLSSYHPEYHSDQGDNGSQNDITTVLFTRRNIDQEARNFLSTLDANTIQELQEKLSRNSSSSCCWSRAPLLTVDL